MTKRRRYSYLRPALPYYTPPDPSVRDRRRVRRLRIGLAISVLLLGWLLVGCWGVGDPNDAGSHSFDGTGSIGVYDPPAVAPFLFTEQMHGALGQFSPDGKWLYLMFMGGGDRLASVSARQEGGAVHVDIGLRFNFSMIGGPFRATRLRFDPPIDPAHPPSVDVGGQPAGIEPWKP